MTGPLVISYRRDKKHQYRFANSEAQHDNAWTSLKAFPKAGGSAEIHVPKQEWLLIAAEYFPVPRGSNQYSQPTNRAPPPSPIPRSSTFPHKALFRGHVARRYAAWCAMHYFSARCIQSGVRGFTARSRARVARTIRAWELQGLPALLLLQRAIRGFLVRKEFSRRFEEAVRVKIIVPAAGVLQKCWRGKKGREEGFLRRRMKAAATEIQASGVV